MPNKTVNYQDILLLAKDIIAIPSPSGYTKDIINYLIKKVKEKNLNYEILNTGNLVITLKGKSNHTIGICSHVDTLGAIVSSINNDGTLKFDCIGGPILPTYDGEYCLIHTRDGKTYTGTFLSNSPSAHVFKDSRTLERNTDNMHIRLDELVHSKNETKELGIQNGDYISLDPKTQITPSGYIKSRFLDDKLSVAIILSLIDDIINNNISLNNTLKFIITVYEEVGFGSSYIPPVDELLAVDMGCVGANLDGNEEKVSICAKDSGGPYNYEINSKLINLAKQNNLDFAIDVFPYYSSDVTTSLKAGNNIKGALIGSGVAASHGMERSHLNGVKNTYDLLKLYVLN